MTILRVRLEKRGLMPAIPEHFGTDRLRRERVTGALEDGFFAKHFGQFDDLGAGAGVDAVEDSGAQRAEVFIERQHGRGDGAASKAGDLSGIDISFGN